MFKTVALTLALVGVTQAYCPNGCSGHGTCSNSNGMKDTCSCFSHLDDGDMVAMWTGADCSLRKFQLAVSSFILCPAAFPTTQLITQCTTNKYGLPAHSCTSVVQVSTPWFRVHVFNKHWLRKPVFLSQQIKKTVKYLLHHLTHLFLFYLSPCFFPSLSMCCFNVASQARAPRPVRGPPLRLLTTITSPTKLNARPKENVTAQVVTALARRDTLVPLASAPSAPTLATDMERASLLPRLPMTFPTMLTMVPRLTSLPFQTAIKTAITALVPRTQVPSTILHGMRLAPRVASVTLASVAPTAL